MSKLLIFVFVVLNILSAKAQSPIGDSLPVKQNVANAPNTLLQTNALKLSGGIQFGYFVDTTAANASPTKCKYYPNAFISTLSGTWKRNSTASKWERQATISDIVSIVGCNSLLTGGVVTYTGTGFVFDVSPANYFINCGGIYHSPQTQVTLAASDPTNPRVDVIAVDTSGAVVVITGTPAANPVKPQINGETQLELTHIEIAAVATTPGGVTTVIIYDENTEWATSSTNVTANFDNTNNPFHATKAVLATSVISGSTFKFDYGSADVNVSNYSALKIYIRIESSTFDYASFYVKFGYNGTILGGVTVISGTYGFTSGLDGVYQVLTIPISDFPLSSNIANELYIQMGSVGFTSCYIDYVQLQGGIPSGNSPYVTNIFRKTGTDSVFQVINSVPVYAFKDSIGTGSGSTYTFTNGITESGGSVKLGGMLTQQTNITGGELILGVDNVIIGVGGTDIGINSVEDKITITSVNGNYYLTEPITVPSTTGRKVLVHDTATGKVERIDPATLVSTPTLQQVLTAGSTLTTGHTIDFGGNDLKIKGDSLQIVNTDGDVRIKLIPSAGGVGSAATRLTFINADAAEMFIQSGDEYLETYSGWYIRNEIGDNTALSINGKTGGQTASYIEVLQGAGKLFEIGADSFSINPPLGVLNIDSLRTWSGISDTAYKKPMTWDTRNGRWEYAANWPQQKINLVFGAGSGADSDTTAFTTSAIYGSFYNDADTIVVTSMRSVLQGTSPDITYKVWYNDSLNVEAGATALVTAGSQVTNTTTGTNVTSFDVTKIPPGVWVWVKTSTVATKPKYFSLTINGYRK